MIDQKAVAELRARLQGCMPDDPNEDGTYRTDGSYESLCDLWSVAFDRAFDVALKAVIMMEAEK